MDIPKSLDMQEKAKGFIPGMTQLLSKRPDLFSLGVWPTYYSKAKGCEVWDLDDNKYIDMSIGGIGATVLGYADDDINEAVITAIQNGTSTSLNCPEEVELAELLCEIHPWASKVRYARTGGEAMTMAVRIARTATGKDKVAFCGYHGWHDWYLAANLGTQNALGEHLIPGLEPNGVPKNLAGTAFPFRHNQLEELQEIVDKHGDDLAAIVMEPIRNSAPTQEFIDGVRTLADQSGATLIVDEISSGFRYISGGAHKVFGIKPDIAVFSKAIGNGHPIAAVIGKEDIMQASQRSFISSTYWTDRVGPVAALATIKKHRENNVGEHLIHLGETVTKAWQKLSALHAIKIHTGGIPQMTHFTFDCEEAPTIKAYFIQEMLEQGFLASTMFYAMYAHKDEHVEKYLSAVGNTFAKISKMTTEEIALNLKGKASISGFKRLN
mgnify:CR=1 FL=1